MSRPKGSKNNRQFRLDNGPRTVKMYRKGNNRLYGWLPSPFPLTMYDCCDYYEQEVLPGDGKFDHYIKIGVKKVSTTNALVASGLGIRPSSTDIVKFLNKNPERRPDLEHLLTGETITQPRLPGPSVPVTFDFSDKSLPELIRILRDDDRCMVDKKYFNAVRDEIQKRRENGEPSV